MIAILLFVYIFAAAIVCSSIEDFKTAQIALAAAIGLPSLAFFAVAVYVCITDLVIPFFQAT